MRLFHSFLSFVLIGSTVGLDSAPAQVENSVSATVTSAASYEATVSPDSLASIFGTDLASGTFLAELTPNGQLPTELGGTRVEIDGIPAGLIFTSPQQINCVLPQGVAVGTVPVVVESVELGVVSCGVAETQLTAPAVFSFDSMGSGPGAIINGVTGAFEPFRVTTEESPSSDKRTRLSIFGTGVRFAGQTDAESVPANLKEHVEVRALDNEGGVHDLTVEYAGATSEFFGLDQLNVVLPPELDGAGTVGFVVSIGPQVANLVTVTIDFTDPPEISTILPQQSPPGAEIVLGGLRFPSFAQDSEPGISVTLQAQDRSVLMPILTVSNTELRVLMPAIVLGDESWFTVPAQVCAGFGTKNVCAPTTIEVLERARSYAAFRGHDQAV